MPDRQMRSPTARLIKLAVANQGIIHEVERMFGCQFDNLDFDEQYIGTPYPSSYNEHILVIKRIVQIEVGDSMLQFIDEIEHDEDENY